MNICGGRAYCSLDSPQSESNAVRLCCRLVNLMIEYPRKCPHCDHMASSPQTFFYHKRTHKPIPPGTLCCGGCGQEAKFITTNNNVWCCKEFSHCPQYSKEQSTRVTKHWVNADDRKIKMIETLRDPEVKKRNIDSMVRTKRKNFCEKKRCQKKDFRFFNRI